MFNSKYDAHKFFIDTAGKHLIGGIDLLKPFRTKLYITSKKEYFRFLIYTVFFSHSYTKETENTDHKNLYIRGPYVDKSPSALEIERIFIKSLKTGINTCKTKDKFEILPSPIRIARIICQIFKGRKISKALILVAACQARAQDDIRRANKSLDLHRYKNVVTFCDAIGIENLVTQMSRSINIRTITLQHGQYRILERKNCSQDIEAIYNFTSDYMFCWGQATKLEFEKAGYSGSKFISVGRFLERNKSAERSWRNTNNRTFGVVLCGPNSRFLNEELLQFSERLSKAYGLRYYIRLHPSDDRSSYDTHSLERFSGFKMDDSHFDLDFSIMTLTGFFLDCLNMKHKFLFMETPNLPSIFSDHMPCISAKDNPYIEIESCDYERLQSFFDDHKNQTQKVNEFLGN